MMYIEDPTIRNMPSVGRRMSWMAERRKRRLTVAIPSSFVSDIPHLREKTLRVGLLARVAAIYRVDEILIYPHGSRTEQKDAEFLKTILSYLETPQYLRRRLFHISPNMQYVGILPPLRTPHHPISKSDQASRVAYREGIVVNSEKHLAAVDIGTGSNVIVEGTGLQTGKRVTIKIEKTSQGDRYSTVSKTEVPFYWGYSVSVSKWTLGETLRHRQKELMLMTSRYGRPVYDVLKDLSQEFNRASKILVVFGSPQEGLIEILSKEELKPQDFTDMVLNTIPNQGTETVRTEEAVYATLAILNVLEEKWAHDQGESI